MEKISVLARRFNLSRSTLLFYDRINLLSPSLRSLAGYRLYSAADAERLALICSYRQSGLSIETIRSLLDDPGEGVRSALQRRMQQIAAEIRLLREQQRLLAGMLETDAPLLGRSRIDKAAWVEMLRAAGMDDAAMRRWHIAFEARSPQAHHDFLLSLGIGDDEALLIRKWSQTMDENDLAPYFFELFAALPRQGPGSAAASVAALEICRPWLPAAPRVLDLGCGSGASTLILAAELPAASIEAIDVHPPFLAKLENEAARLGLAPRIRTVSASFLETSWPAAAFDLIWAEGALYLAGIETALARFAPLLAPNGVIAFTELVWSGRPAPAAVKEYWQAAYPQMSDLNGNTARIAAAGLEIIDAFLLPVAAWEETYYRPMEEELPRLLARHPGEPAAETVAGILREEIALYRTSDSSYSYAFFIARKPA